MTTASQIGPRRMTLGHRITRLLQAWLVAPVVRWHRRNELYRELVDLDDRILADIGVSRFDIPYFVRNAPVDEDVADTNASNEDEPPHREGDESEPRLAA